MSRRFRVNGSENQLIGIVVARIEATDSQTCTATMARARDGGNSSTNPTSGATITAIAICWPS
jgi:hypothetical protein